MTDWRTANNRRASFYADVHGRRLFVHQTVRSDRAFGVLGSEYQAMIDGIRIGEFRCLENAKAAAVRVAQTKTAPQGDSAGPSLCWIGVE